MLVNHGGVTYANNNQVGLLAIEPLAGGQPSVQMDEGQATG